MAFVVGLGLGGWAVYAYLKVAERLGAGRCDGCEPWHPLIVAAFAAGSAFVLLSVGLFYRR